MKSTRRGERRVLWMYLRLSTEIHHENYNSEIGTCQGSESEPIRKSFLGISAICQAFSVVATAIAFLAIAAT